MECRIRNQYFCIWFHASGMFFGALSIICEYDNQTTILLKLSPYSSRTVFLGKMSACLIKSLLSGIIYYFVYAAVFHRFAVTALVICMGTAFALWILGGGFGPLSFFGKAKTTYFFKTKKKSGSASRR